MLKNAFFWKKLEKFPQRLGLRPQTPVGLRRLGGLSPDPRDVIITQFKVILEHFTDFSASLKLKLQPIISHLSDD